MEVWDGFRSTASFSKKKNWDVKLLGLLFMLFLVSALSWLPPHLLKNALHCPVAIFISIYIMELAPKHKLHS